MEEMKVTGIMSASQLKALSNSATEKIAVATGFQSGTLVAVIFVVLGLCLSFALRLGDKKLSLPSDLRLENEQISNS